MSTRNRDKPDGDKEGIATYLPKEEAGISFPPNRTALLIIDSVNDFLSEGGADWEMTKTTVEMNDVVGNLRQAIEGARARGIHVLFGPMAYTEEDYAHEQLHRRSGINRYMFEKKMFLAGTWGQTFTLTYSHKRRIRYSCRTKAVTCSRPTFPTICGKGESLIW